MNLTDEQKEQGRRNFLKAIAGTPALLALGVAAAARGPIKGGPVKAAVIGAGGMGRGLIAQCQKEFIDLRALCDINPKRRRAVAESMMKSGWPQPKEYEDWREMLGKEDLEAVIIATPLWSHAEIAVGCLDAGKHVLCEKMIAKTEADCMRMIDASRRNRRVLGIGYQRYYNPIYQAAYNNIVKQGLLGDASAFLILLLASVFALFAPPCALAQTGGGGSIQGTITDSGGSVVHGATVVATNVATKIESTRQTNEAGLYVISPLPPGEYTVSVSATGFQTLIQEKVIVDALSAVSVNLALKVGAVSDTVTVADAPPQLNTADARLGTTIRNELYTNLPLAMGTAVAGSGIGQGPRNPGAFIFLLPGVSEGNRWGTINGAQGFSKDVFIEGVPITDPIQQGEGRTISLGVSVEAVEQFQVETSGAGVEFNGQGSENYTIKSGGNQFHGSGFEFFRNTVLDARGFFPAVRPVERQNEFGANIGGPILKKKLFFFFSYDGWRYRVVSPTQFASLPTLKERVGDFSELLALPTPVQIYDPLTTVAVPGGFSRTQFSDPSRATAANPLGLNIIPLNRISAISKVYQSPPAPSRSRMFLSNRLIRGAAAIRLSPNLEVKLQSRYRSSG